MGCAQVFWAGIDGAAGEPGKASVPQSSIRAGIKAQPQGNPLTGRRCDTGQICREGPARPGGIAKWHPLGTAGRDNAGGGHEALKRIGPIALPQPVNGAARVARTRRQGPRRPTRKTPKHAFVRCAGATLTLPCAQPEAAFEMSLLPRTAPGRECGRSPRVRKRLTLPVDAAIRDLSKTVNRLWPRPYQRSEIWVRDKYGARRKVTPIDQRKTLPEPCHVLPGVWLPEGA